MPDHFTLDDEFQDSILSHFVAHPEKFLAYGEILQPSYFQGAQATVIAYALLDYVKKYGKPPSWATLKQLALDQNKRLSLADDAEVIKYVEQIREHDTSDVDFVVARVITFARERATVNAIKKAVELIKEKKTPEDGFVKLFQDALQVGQNLDDLGLVFHMDYETVIDRVTKSDYGTLSGFPQWDRIWKRGWGPGWLVTFVAPPKRYKTAVCMNLALNVISPMQGGDVLYYPCEITQELAFCRGLTNITQKGMNYLYENPEKFKEMAKTAVVTSVAGNLVIKGYAAGTATITTIRNHARLAIQQFGLKKLKAIIIDYADTVLPAGTYEKEYLRQAGIYTEARALGAEFGVPVIMPDRMTKEATDSRVPNMKAFQGAFAKGGIVDVAIGLCMTEDEYAENIFRTFVFINRHGAAFQHFRGKVDPETMTVDIGEEIPYEPEDERSGDGDRKPRRKGGKKSSDFDDDAFADDPRTKKRIDE
jgi:replicative DNA helicase